MVFLCGAKGSSAQRRRKLHELAERASVLAREKFDLSLYFGAAPAGESKLLSQSYHAALAAAESALTQQKPMVTAVREVAVAANSLRELRAELGRIEERPAILAARFERYLEAVSLHCGHRTETANAHLEVGFEDVGASLLEAGVLEPKSVTTMRDSLRRATADARNMNELFAAYRRAFADVSDAVQRPVPARRARSLHRAIEYIRHHFTGALRIADVARVAGFNRSHFSRLFIEREGMPFEDYVLGLRLERSQELLTATELHVGRIAELSGFGSPSISAACSGAQSGWPPPISPGSAARQAGTEPGYKYKLTKVQATEERASVVSDRCNAPPRSLRSVSRYFSSAPAVARATRARASHPTSLQPPERAGGSPPVREARSPKAHRPQEQRTPAAPEETAPGFLGCCRQGAFARRLRSRWLGWNGNDDPHAGFVGNPEAGPVKPLACANLAAAGVWENITPPQVPIGAGGVGVPNVVVNPLAPGELYICTDHKGIFNPAGRGLALADLVAVDDQQSAPEPASSRATARPAKLAPQISTSPGPSSGVRSSPRLVALIGIELSVSGRPVSAIIDRRVRN